MSNAIKSSPIPAIASQGSATAQPADWLARQGADRGAEGQGGSFARWMAQHSPQAMPAAAQAQRTPTAQAAATQAHAARPATPQAASRSGSGWNATQQKLAAARNQSATSAHVQAQAAGQGAAARQATASQAQAKADAAKADAAKSTQAASGAKGTQQAQGKPAEVEDEGQTTEATQDAQASDRTTTAQGEAAVAAQEAAPQANAAAHDPAGMMAWLAHLTQSGAAAPTEAGSALAGGEAGESAEAEGRGLKLGLGQGDDGRGRGHGLGLGLGWRLHEQGLEGGIGKALGGARGDAALQVDALLGKGSDAQALLGADKGLGQDVAALMAGDGSRAASFGQTLAEVKQALPHAQASLPTPLDAPEFSQKLADQVSLWVGQARNDGPMTAELHLNPAEMGPINVKISLDGQAAHVDFAAAALETRQAIEASLSMLSSALNDVGLSLSGGGVFSQTSQQQAGQGSGAAAGQSAGIRNATGQDDGEAEPLGMRQVSAPRTGRLGGLDLYA
ncbi:MAG: flagellar hook-length control protein FliK [Proteobacteria bacterium]|uniref:flagellar hook-length control protein FliK n=1 Tax=Aquabacterium sp. TaxID=1872578 RepID=UPI0035C68A50|nr:flagellar hook-length control protein FliK [Pseudomonadota bacterium]